MNKDRAKGVISDIAISLEKLAISFDSYSEEQRWMALSLLKQSFDLLLMEIQRPEGAEEDSTKKENKIQEVKDFLVAYN